MSELTAAVHSRVPSPAVIAGADVPAAGPPARARRSPPTPSRAGAAVLLVGLLATAALAYACHEIYESNEQRLLDLRVNQLGLVFTAVVPDIQTPLTSAAELVSATGGSSRRFTDLMSAYVGGGREFTSASLWRLGPAPEPLAHAGSPPSIAPGSAQARSAFARPAPRGGLRVVSLLTGSRPGVGYELAVPGVGGRFAVFAETRLQADRRSRRESNSAFSQLNYVVYLGRESPSDLLVTNSSRIPPAGRRASDVVPFGNSALTLLVSPRTSLGGGFFANLQWIVAIAGALISLLAAVVGDRLVRRRRLAEQLAGRLDLVARENQRMYAEQQGIAQTLQHALLPTALPLVPGLNVDVRYVPASSGLDVGGDWYDVIECGESCVLMVIGDVSGHGLQAATTMAAVRHAALAYAAIDCDPEAVLDKLSRFVINGGDSYFATVLCALIDVDAHRLTVASAGHLPPLLLDDDGVRFMDVNVNVPIGVRTPVPYRAVSVDVSAGTTLLAYTDGLVERRGESIDDGLERLRVLAGGTSHPLASVLGRLAAMLADGDNRDDTAIVGVQWQS